MDVPDLYCPCRILFSQCSSILMSSMTPQMSHLTSAGIHALSFISLAIRDAILGVEPMAVGVWEGASLVWWVYRLLRPRSWKLLWCRAVLGVAIPPESERTERSRRLLLSELPHNRFSTYFFSMKMTEFWKMVLVSCIIDFDDIQFFLRSFAWISISAKTAAKLWQTSWFS